VRDQIPALKPEVDLRKLQLSPAEGYVLSRVDGRTSFNELLAITRLPEARLTELLGRLVRDGLVVLQAGAGTRPAVAVADAPVQQRPPSAPDCLEEAPAEGPPESATHRKLYETKLHPLEADARVSLAAGCDDPELSALCFDPLPQVVRSLLENPRFGPVHARLVAAHHREPRGLEALAGRAELLRDIQVQRLLLRNPQLPEPLLKRMLASRRMLELHKVGISREATERVRRTASQVLRQRFSTGAAEERVELILQTEGRALGGLAGIAVDGKTASLLCARTMHSTVLIQNIARWAAAPPPLIAFLLKSPLVRRQPQLRQALQRHPNAPSSSVT
jgi:hypothetical protein